MLKIIGLAIMVALNAILLDYGIAQNKTIKKSSSIIPLVYIILSLPLIHLTNYWIVMANTLGFILIYQHVSNFTDTPSIKQNIFKASFLLGLMIIIDYNFIWCYFLILISLFYYSQFKRSHVLIQLIGTLYAPLIYYSLSQMYSLPNNPIKLMESFKYQIYYFNDYLLFSCVFFVLFILSLHELYKNYSRKTEKAKKSFNVLLFFTILILFKTIILNSKQFIHLLIIPSTIVIANYLIYTKHSKFRTFLLGLLFMSFIFKFLYL